PLPPARESPDTLDCLARPGVGGSLRLEQRQHPLGAIGGPESDEAAVFFAQRHPATSVAERPRSPAGAAAGTACHAQPEWRPRPEGAAPGSACRYLIDLSPDVTLCRPTVPRSSK